MSHISITPCKGMKQGGLSLSSTHESFWLQALAPVREGLERRAGGARRGAGRAGRAAQPRTTTAGPNAPGELLPNQLVSLDPADHAYVSLACRRN